jgi:hypothetical protein
MTLGNAAASGDDGHHVDNCGLQVFRSLSSNSKSEDKMDASEFDVKGLFWYMLNLFLV